jgi:glycerophosphoryl diester phosphodiesterase
VKAPAAVDGLLATLAARQLSDHPLIQLSSFNWETTLRLHKALPTQVVGFVTPRFDIDEVERVVTAGLPQICPRADLLTPDLVKASHACGLNVRAWGVQTREHLALVYATGADGTTLNWPDWAADEMSKMATAGLGAG